jgi:ABC-type multidrug transport system fused ATPase/permease subunit
MIRIQSVVVSATSLPKLFGTLFPLVLTMVAAITFLGRLVEPHQREARKADEHAYTFLEQCLSGVRIVRTFGMRSHLIARFGHQILGQAEQSGVKQVAIQTIESGLIMTIFFFITSLMIFYGGRLIRDGANLGQVVAVSVGVKLNRSSRLKPH